MLKFNIDFSSGLHPEIMLFQWWKIDQDGHWINIESMSPCYLGVQHDPDPPLTLVCQGAQACMEIVDDEHKSLSKEEIQEA